MKSKILAVLFAAFLFSIAFISAATTFSGLSGTITLSQGANSSQFTLSATNASNLINISLSVGAITLDDNTITTPTLSPSSILNFNTTQIVTVTASPDWSKLTLGKSYTSTLLAYNDNNQSDNATATITLTKGFCDYGYKGNSTRKITIKSVKDKTSDDEFEWKPLDNVEIEVKVEFDGKDSKDEVDIVVELGLYDSQEDEFLDLGEDEILEEDLTLEDGDSGTVKFNVEVPIDVEDDSSGRYKLFVKAYEDGEEDTLCAETFDSKYYEEITIEKKNYEVILKDISATDEVPCGSEVLVIANVYNIGSNDEDKVYVNLYNKELGLNMNSGTFSLDEGDKRTVSFNFLIPVNATEKKYALELTTYYRYIKSSDTFKEYSKDNFKAYVIVKGRCINGSGASATITAEYSDETPKAVIGNEVIIKSTLKNTGLSTTTFVLDVPAVSWAEVVSITPKVLTLASGETGTSEIKLKISENATIGNKEFTIKATSNGQTIEQKVQLALEKGNSWNIVKEHIKKNWFIYTIILVNIILLIIIIIVIINVAKRSD